jgi:AcrR family transcriptional regulator
MMSPTRSNPTGRPAYASDHDSREHLLDTATALFAERGIANTTIAQIAAAGGVTSAMVHYWFKTRERLLDAVVEERLAAAFRAVWGRVDPASEEAPLTQMAGILSRLFEVTEKKTWLPSLWLREIINEGGLLRERAFRRIPFKKVQSFGEGIARGKARGEVNQQIDPLLLFSSILALVMLPQATSKIWQRVHPAATFDHANLKRHVTALLLYGVTGNRAPAAAPAPAGHSRATLRPRSKRKAR